MSDDSREKTQIDFYHLKDDNLAVAVAMLADKAVSSGKKILVITQKAHIAEISDALWTTKPDTFLAHGCDNDTGADYAPVWISTSTELNPIDADFVCVTDGLVPAEILKYKRLFNLFDGTDDNAVRHARTQWKGWSADDTLSCRYFAQDDTGRWALKG